MVRSDERFGSNERNGMKVMVMVKATANSEAGALGKRVRFSSDGTERQILDGPFTETRELVAGFWMWEVKSMDEALEWARRCPAPMPGEECDLELRPVVGLEDFGDVVTPEMLEREAKQRAALAAKGA
jgi:hypothetical protein